jgi:hypothetical protein
MQSTSKKTKENSKNSIKKDTKLWILTEGMAGTENQCLGVADYLGVSDVVVKRIDLKFPFHFLCPAIIKRPPLWAFTGDKLDEPWPDIVIASGRKAVSACLAIPRAFKVFIQNPRIDPKYFDLLAIPAHDDVISENVMITKGAPNRINDNLLSKARDKFKGQFAHLPDKKIAVMIGGNSKTHAMPDGFAQDLFKSLTPYIQSGDYGFLITCSRRTPDMIKHQIEQLFASSNCITWNGQGNNPYHAYLAMADILMVTEDSTSMLSDALTTGKPTYRLRLDGGSPKFDRLYKTLSDHGGLRIFEGNLEQWTYEPLNDAKMVADEIKKHFAKHQEGI